ncbi:MAG: signal recognition particle receptor subunit alpha, partial [Roseiarcus sp.]
MTFNDDGAEKSKAGLLRRLFSRAGPNPPPQAPADAVAPQTVPAPARRAWFARLRSGLSRSSASIGQGIVDIVSKRRLDAAALDDLEEVLIRADLGVAAAARIREAVARGRYDKTIEPQEVRAILAAEVERILAPVARPLVVDARKKPFVILVVGVNGSGKTTTIGKLAAKFSADGLNVTLAAGDT